MTCVIYIRKDCNAYHTRNPSDQFTNTLNYRTNDCKSYVSPIIINTSGGRWVSEPTRGFESFVRILLKGLRVTLKRNVAVQVEGVASDGKRYIVCKELRTVEYVPLEHLCTTNAWQWQRWEFDFDHYHLLILDKLEALFTHVLKQPFWSKQLHLAPVACTILAPKNIIFLRRT